MSTDLKASTLEQFQRTFEKMAKLLEPLHIVEGKYLKEIFSNNF